MKNRLIALSLLTFLATLNTQLSALHAQSTAFTYQGRLNDAAGPANGSYDLTFYLRDALTTGNPVGTTNTLAPVAVSNGLFTVTLDFGADIFTGPARWLEIGVRTNGSVGAYTTLSPRQALTATPYALFATTVTGAGIQDATVTGAKLAVPLTLSGSTASGTAMLSGINDAGNGLAGTSTSGRGVYGRTAAAGLTNAGVYGESSAADSTAVVGTAMNVDSIGVTGVADWSGGIGVYGRAVDHGVVGATTGGTGVAGTSISGPGVFGSSSSYRGVYGTSAAAGSTVAGVYGENSAAGGNAIIGTALNENSTGVAGVADLAGGNGLYGRGANNGVLGATTGAGGNGVSGNSSSGTGVRGTSDSGTGVSGTAFGGNGVSGTSGTGTGVSGTSGSGTGVFGSSEYSWGVYGISAAAGPTFAGVYGENDAAGGTAVVGTALNVNSAGVAGVADVAGGTGVYGRGANYAGAFDGRVVVSTDLIVYGNKNFKIDHPLDPANKYLLHSCVESPDVMNIYNGNITTDASGEAVVALPSYFEALNRDFRYQLTVIGQFAQAIVATKIKGNQFTIKTDKPDVEVSWQVTGIRQDAYMKAHPMVVEQDKPANERGTYQHPELFGQPEEKGLSWSRNPELWKRLRTERTERAALPKP